MNEHDEKAPVAQTAARRLQEMIRSGELKKGEKIPSQRVLSERLRVSRPSLREALLTLETLGLVRTLPARGTFVVDPDGRQQAAAVWRYDDAYSIDEVFQSRLLIETELCRLAAAVITPAALDAMSAANAEFESAWQSGDLLTHVEADLRFHRLIAEACPNRMLRRLYESVQELLTESQRQPIPNTAVDRMAQSIQEHRDIVAALQRRDGAAAAGAMGAHVGNTARSAGATLD
ncbi:transcriptional regulator, GntR family [Tranquillimonas rosea]|uniref:Transcriptional regulator, GntR family n=1 Tax=Tranquillimonas rosea TaxID=641238 RepID=A0A1H9WIQ7_9RHOB|nr:FadR/GntR family transcriptional regulator [Tranquillimonas rosea]SES33768.1 transcriptional regulator, GntR family [Tranquillimonas rosea]